LDKVSRGHVSRMTMRGVALCPTAAMFQGADSVDKGSVIIRYKKKQISLSKKVLSRGTTLPRSHVSSMIWAGSRTLLSRSHVSSMTGGCPCPIYYQEVVNLEKGGVIIRCKLPELIKNILRQRTPLSSSHISSMTMVGSRTLLSRSHVSSMTGGCTCPIYYQGVVSVEKGGVIIRYKLPEPIKKVCQAGNPAVPQPYFKHDYGRESNPALPQPCFQHDRRMYLSDMLPESCQCRKRRCDNSIQIT